MVIRKVTIHAWARYCDHCMELLKTSKLRDSLTVLSTFYVLIKNIFIFQEQEELSSTSYPEYYIDQLKSLHAVSEAC